VSLRKVDLAVELQILSFYQRRKGGDGQRRSSIEAGAAVDADVAADAATDAAGGTAGGAASRGRTKAPARRRDNGDPAAGPDATAAPSSAPTSG